MRMRTETIGVSYNAYIKMCDFFFKILTVMKFSFQVKQELQIQT